MSIESRTKKINIRGRKMGDGRSDKSKMDTKIYANDLEVSDQQLDLAAIFHEIESCLIRIARSSVLDCKRSLTLATMIFARATGGTKLWPNETPGDSEIKNRMSFRVPSSSWSLSFRSSTSVGAFQMALILLIASRPVRAP